MFSEEMLREAAFFSYRNRAEVEKSEKCGCYYCGYVFSPAEMTEDDWTLDEGEWSTACCPKCSVDSVLPSSSGFPLTKEFLDAMYERSFDSYVEIEDEGLKALLMSSSPINNPSLPC